MTDEQIIKALEVIASADIGDCSRDCGFYDGKVHFCGGVVAKHSLDIINRQKAEIDRFADIGKMYSEVRAEAIREFAERLFERVVVKTLVGKSEDYSDGFIEATSWYDEEIDNLVKEMTEGQP